MRQSQAQELFEQLGNGELVKKSEEIIKASADIIIKGLKNGDIDIEQHNNALDQMNNCLQLLQSAHPTGLLVQSPQNKTVATNLLKALAASGAAIPPETPSNYNQHTLLANLTKISKTRKMIKHYYGAEEFNKRRQNIVDTLLNNYTTIDDPNPRQYEIACIQEIGSPEIKERKQEYRFYAQRILDKITNTHPDMENLLTNMLYDPSSWSKNTKIAAKLSALDPGEEISLYGAIRRIGKKAHAPFSSSANLIPLVDLIKKKDRKHDPERKKEMLLQLQASQILCAIGELDASV